MLTKELAFRVLKRRKEIKDYYFFRTLNSHSFNNHRGVSYVYDGGLYDKQLDWFIQIKTYLEK